MHHIVRLGMAPNMHWVGQVVQPDEVRRFAGRGLPTPDGDGTRKARVPAGPSTLLVLDAYQ
jgi:hypothetical protein